MVLTMEHHSMRVSGRLLSASTKALPCRLSPRARHATLSQITLLPQAAFKLRYSNRRHPWEAFAAGRNSSISHTSPDEVCVSLANVRRTKLYALADQVRP